MPNPGDIIIPFDPDKLAAVAQFSSVSDLSIADELTAAAEKIYQRRVPAPVRQFIEKRPAPPPKPKKPPARTEAGV